MTAAQYDKIEARLERLRKYVNTCPDWWTHTQLGRDLDALEKLLLRPVKPKEKTWTR